MSNDVAINVKVDADRSGFGGLEQSLRRVKERAKDAADGMGRIFRDDSRGGGLGGATAVAGKLASTIGNTLMDALSNAGAAAMRFGQDVVQGLGQISSAGGPVGSAIGVIVQALLMATAAAAAAGGAFVALAPALLAVGGAAAAAAGALVGLGGAFGAIKIGIGGIGDALAAHGKSMGGAGKAATNTAEQEHQAAMRIRNATRALVDAKRAEREAIADVNRARQSEIERLKDLDAQIKGGAISEKEAALELREAGLAVQNMDAGASEEDKARMRNRLERAQLEYDETVRRNKGLAEERKKADKVGVDGSDQVRAALERQARTHEQVIRAQEALAEAQRKVATASGGASGGVNAFNEAMKKLSPNARELVRTLIDLGKRWDDVRKRVQDRFLEGASDTIRGLATKWIPVLESTLGKMADRLNFLGRDLAKTLGSGEFIKNFKRASDVGGEFISRVGGGIPALVNGFMRLAASSGPVLEVIGKALRGIFEWFDKWLSSAQKSGALDRFMKSAATTLDKIFNVGKQAFGVMGEFISIIFPSSEKTANSVFDSIAKQLETVKKFLQDPENRAAIKRIADAFGAFIYWLVSEAIPAFVDFTSFTVQAAFVIIREWNRVKTFFELVVLALRKMWNLFLLNLVNGMIAFVDVLDSTLGKIIPGLHSKLDGAKARLTQFKNDTNKTLSQIKDRAVTIRFRQVFEVVGQTIQAVAKQLVDIGAVKRGKASGGVVGADGLTWTGEHGPELRNLAPGSRVYSNPDSARMMSGHGGQGSSQNLSGTLRLAVDRTAERGVVAELFKMFRAEIGNNYGGDVQLALGRG